MTIYVRNVQRVRLAEEPNGAFATEIGLGSFLDLPFTEGSLTLALNHTTQSPEHSQQHVDGYPKEVLLPKDAQADFSINLETLDTKAGDGVTAAQSALGRLLKIVMGGEHLGTGTTVTGGTAEVPKVADASGLAIGSVVGFATGPGGSLEMREIADIQPDNGDWDLTLKLALSAAPAGSSTCYSAATYYMDGTTGDETTYAQMTFEGLSDNDRWLCLGGQLASTPTIELNRGGIPRLSFSIKFAQWFRADGVETAMDLTAAPLAFANYVDAKTIVHADSEFRSQLNGTTTLAGTLIDAPEITYAPNIEYTEHRSSAGVNTVVQWVRNRSAPVIGGEFTIPLEDQAWYDARDNLEDRAFWLQIGTSPLDGGILLSAPTTQVTDTQLIDTASLQGQTQNWKGRLDEDTNTAGGVTDLAVSAFRLALL